MYPWTLSRLRFSLPRDRWNGKLVCYSIWSTSAPREAKVIDVHSVSKSPVFRVAFIRNSDPSHPWIEAEFPRHINSLFLGFIAQVGNKLAIALHQHVASYWSRFKASWRVRFYVYVVHKFSNCNARIGLLTVMAAWWSPKWPHSYLSVLYIVSTYTSQSGQR